MAPRQIAENTGLAVLNLPFDYPSPESTLYWHREYAGDPALTWMRGLIRDIARELMDSEPQEAPVTAA